MPRLVGLVTARSTDDVTVVVLAGGRGTRIAALYPDLPKPLIPVNGRPFVAWLTEFIAGFGPRTFLYATGHMADQVADWAADGTFPGLDRQVCPEPSPLGTGGGLLNCLDRVRTDWVLVVNGDGVCVGGLDALLSLRAETGLDGALIGVRVEDTSRYGSLAADRDGLLQAFREKIPGQGFANSGFYLFTRDVLARVRRPGPSSLERDLIPAMLSAGRRLRTVFCEGTPFIDIGTPESLAEADRFVRDHMVRSTYSDRG